MRLYIDESGLISDRKNPRNRYFVMAFVQTDQASKCRSEFRQAKNEYIMSHENYPYSATEEIKGSKMPNEMKAMIFDRLRENTDAQFHFLVIDNYQLYDNLLRIPALSFNYFIGLMVDRTIQHEGYSKRNPDALFLMIDNRNQAVESLNSLEEYLQIKFTIEKRRFADVQVTYQDSRDRDMIQIADVFANTIFRIVRSEAMGDTDSISLDLVKKCRIGGHRFFPSGKSDLNFIK
ncbi:hypothetical protein AWM75_04450 [Aerococcus urinaehominis]|uniref:Uncharacterized protein n=1 Tax=Aerococcus urinaehominis TaxID=128944 RepID=A0A0X8FL89_9LACT|nr:DUF3800 domain-containing protein [Aerococcus urinaehominis]AMB99297.1 hypothetical protein AWM75_04450 [Aerococcus urinaehominis]SDM19371.1 Protein of unknown function [Aerococcus urinaehominis]